MKVKKLLFVAFIISLPFFLIFGYDSKQQVRGVYQQLHYLPVLISLAASAIILMCAHVLRAYKTKRLTDVVKVTSWRTHTRALFIGYLFNALLPFRLGEIIRALIAGKGMKMSASFLFSLVLLERALDGFILGAITLGLLVWTPVFSDPQVHRIMLLASVTLVTTTSLILLMLYLVRKQPPSLVRYLHRTSKLFNDDVRDSIRFKLWSVMYGTELVLTKRTLKNYIFQTIAMWLLYLAAVLPLSYHYLHKPAVQELSGVSTVAYLGVAAPTGPSYVGSYQTFVQPYIDAKPQLSGIRELLMTAWFLQIIPAFLVGLIFVLRTNESFAKLDAPGSHAAASLTGDKLLRDADISHDLGSFLDAFFTNNSLSRIMHKLELGKNSKLIRYFKGGSNAITALVYQDGAYVVRKITPLQYKYKLESQFDWLKKHQKTENIVNVLSDETGSDYYKIDIEFNEEYAPFFDYIHSQPVAKSKLILDDVFKLLFKKVYKFDAEKLRMDDLKSYIEGRCLSKIRQASEINDEIRSLTAYDEIIINGKSYRNIHLIIDEILGDAGLCKKLATYRKSSIHGDVTIDNILAAKSTDDFLLIDPNDNENEISGPVFDFGRLGESLMYGYEFLNRDESKSLVEENRIEFEVSRSHQYAVLEKHTLGLQEKYLTSNERFAVPFHAAMMYSRMLTHRVQINPLNAAKYYAVSVIAFNRFINEAAK